VSRPLSLLCNRPSRDARADTVPLQLRPTHEALCGRDPDVFYFAPLSPADLEQLERMKGDVFPISGGSFADYVAKLFKVRPWPVRPAFLSLDVSYVPSSAPTNRR